MQLKKETTYKHNGQFSKNMNLVCKINFLRKTGKWYLGESYFWNNKGWEYRFKFSDGLTPFFNSPAHAMQFIYDKGKSLEKVSSLEPQIKPCPICGSCVTMGKANPHGQWSVVCPKCEYQNLARYGFYDAIKDHNYSWDERHRKARDIIKAAKALCKNMETIEGCK